MCNSLLTLLKLMSLFPSLGFADVTRTSDGFYLARGAGDAGFDRFLGKPRVPHDGPALRGAVALWHKLAPGDRRQVIKAARARNVNLRDFLPRPERAMVIH